MLRAAEERTKKVRAPPRPPLDAVAAGSDAGQRVCFHAGGSLQRAGRPRGASSRRSWRAKDGTEGGPRRRGSRQSSAASGSW